jgi:hypothetical protein
MDGKKDVRHEEEKNETDHKSENSARQKKKERQGFFRLCSIYAN